MVTKLKPTRVKSQDTPVNWDGLWYEDPNNFSWSAPGEASQSDWNETDTTKASYIKNKPTIPEVIDNVVTEDSDNALSANMWKKIWDEIETLRARGKYLSDWDAMNWVAKTLPTSWTTYTYNAWDYFIVYNVDRSDQYEEYDPTETYNTGDKCSYNSAYYICNTDWTTWTRDSTKWDSHTIWNFRPEWSQYVVPVVPSDDPELDEVSDWDFYTYDWTIWILQLNHWKTVSFSNLAWSPYDNTSLANALNSKQDKLPELWDTWDVLTVTGGVEARWPMEEWYHVPSKDERGFVLDAWIALWAWTSSGDDLRIKLKLPFAGYRYNVSSSVDGQGSYAYYWSSIAYSDNYAYFLYAHSSMFYPTNWGYRANGYSIRCFKNTPVIPDSTWTVITQWTWTAGIYHNATLWLISISSDWTTWYTLQDKNLGATTVYNDWDTLSQANCGNYYQWWNCYWFPYTGTVTTSSTKVDASWYGKWNLYSSSTFITVSDIPYDWSSVRNDNLRWMETTSKQVSWKPIPEWWLVDDVKVNGVSVVDENKVANVSVPTPGNWSLIIQRNWTTISPTGGTFTANKSSNSTVNIVTIDDVRVDNSSVVDANKVANIDLSWVIKKWENSVDTESVFAAEDDNASRVTVNTTSIRLIEWFNETWVRLYANRDSSTEPSLEIEDYVDDSNILTQYKSQWISMEDDVLWDKTYTFDNTSTWIATLWDLSWKQDTLVSGTNIKTIWWQSILGSGDLVIWGWDMEYADFEFDPNTWNDVTLSLSTTLANVTWNVSVHAPTDIKAWQVYVLRVTNGSWHYKLNLDADILNTRWTSTDLTPNSTDQFVFYAISDSLLELQPEWISWADWMLVKSFEMPESWDDITPILDYITISWYGSVVLWDWNYRYLMTTFDATNKTIVATAFDGTTQLRKQIVYTTAGIATVTSYSSPLVEWVGTYKINISSTAPASWTPNTTITFVTA